MDLLYTRFTVCLRVPSVATAKREMVVQQVTGRQHSLR